MVHMKKGIFKSVLFIVSLLLCLETFSKAENKNKTDKKSAKSLDLNAVRVVVHSHLEEVQKCYTDLIIEGMAAKGKVMAGWDIDDKGSVQNLVIKANTSKDQALEGCVTEKVINWTFPAAEAGKTFSVSYPFQFGE
jgi:inosine-uridine nucleoside N-ribohydrolase